ncbi:TadE/TadG family type IV pilus assembly protein [Streptomyces sp. NPDC058221]|uniref:TadE/TadG family type IV pilus assembly protein n=1 Tax=Streptomyces sp. NPDC058221 TaxID=3346388 RepID=UPI0036EDD2CA
MATMEMAETGIGRRRDRDRGQTAIEFVGVTPLIILLLVALWQCALIGYTFSLASNAADEAARAASGAERYQQLACKRAAKEDLPEVWKGASRAHCRLDRGLYKSTVKLRVPVLVPGVLNFPFPVEGNAASVREG